ncbi:MAG: hypothetical protein QXT64_02695 [Desulfurococcaceae archaeon]
MEEDNVVDEVVLEALRHYNQLENNLIYRDVILKVGIVDDVLIIEHGFDVYIIFCYSYAEAKVIADAFLSLYKNLGGDRIALGYFIHSIADYVTQHYDPLYSYEIYRTKKK